MKSVINTGVKVIASSAETSITALLVNASGIKSLPSCPCNKNTGAKLSKIISVAKKTGFATCLHAEMITLKALILSRTRLPSLDAAARCRCAFSIKTIPLSTITPMATAIPIRLMMLLVILNKRISRKLPRIAVGIIAIITRLERTARRNTAVTMITMMIS